MNDKLDRMTNWYDRATLRDGWLTHQIWNAFGTTSLFFPPVHHHQSQGPTRKSVLRIRCPSYRPRTTWRLPEIVPVCFSACETALRSIFFLFKGVAPTFFTDRHRHRHRDIDTYLQDMAPSPIAPYHPQRRAIHREEVRFPVPICKAGHLPPRVGAHAWRVHCVFVFCEAAEDHIGVDDVAPTASSTFPISSVYAPDYSCSHFLLCRTTIGCRSCIVINR